MSKDSKQSNDLSSNEGEDEVEQSTPSVIRLLQNIQSGQVLTTNLAVEDRRACVEHLTCEGYSINEIVEILKSSRRTVSRDREQIRVANQLKADPDFAAQRVGHLLRAADNSIERIRRAARHRDATVAERVEAERSCWLIERDVVQLLQRIGLVPMVAQKIQGDLTHRVTMPDVDLSGMPHVADQLQQLLAAAGNPNTNAVRGSMDRRSLVGGALQRELAGLQHLLAPGTAGNQPIESKQ